MDQFHFAYGGFFLPIIKAKQPPLPMLEFANERNPRHTSKPVPPGKFDSFKVSPGPNFPISKPPQFL